MPRQQRQFYLDYLRFVATIAVVFLHVSVKDYHTAFPSFNWYLAVIGDSMMRWSVPLFVMISGVLFLNPDKKITYKDILSKYLPRLLIAYVSWYLIYILFQISISSILQKRFVFDNSFLTPYFHLWFLPMLMGVYLFIPVLRKVSESFSLMRYALILWIGFLAIGFILDSNIPQIGELFLINIVFGFSGYFLLGHYISQYPVSKRQQGLIYTIGVLGLLITIGGNIILSLHRGSAVEKFLSFLSPFVAVTSVAIFVLAKQNDSLFQRKFSAVVNYTRKDLFGIYLIHGIWLRIINVDLLRNLFNHAISLPLITIIIFVLSLYTSKIIRKIPYLRMVVE